MTTPTNLAQLRAEFEHWYATHAHNYSRDPIGSRDCSLQWEAWKAAHESRAQQDRAPDGYAYRYPWHTGGTVIRFSNGEEINGSKPLEAIPFYYGQPPAQPASVTDEVSAALDVVNDAANDARHGGDYNRANALVKARIALWRSAQPASVADDQIEAVNTVVTELYSAAKELNASIDEATEQLDIEAWMSGERVHRARDRVAAAVATIEPYMLAAAPQPPANERVHVGTICHVGADKYALRAALAMLAAAPQPAKENGHDA